MQQPSAGRGVEPVAFLLNSLEVGGSEKKIVGVANALHRRGWPVHLVYLNPPHTLLERVDPSLPLLCLERRGKFDFGAVKRLRAYVQAHGIAHIHCINRYPMIYGRLAAPLDATGRPAYSVFINSTKVASRLEEAKMVIYGPLLRQARRVIFGCRQQQRLWSERNRLRDGRCEVIYNGVDTGRFTPGAHADEGRRLREELGWSSADVVVGTVGQLRPIKGHRDFIAACAQLRDHGRRVRGLIVGSGPEYDRLRALVTERGLEDSVHFLGETRDVRPAVEAMDVFALTSLAETFSNAALEAMALQRPVVLSDLGGAGEMVDSGDNGFIYPVGDVDALVRTLGRLVDDAALRRKMGQRAREKVEDRFAYERMLTDYEAVAFAARGHGPARVVGA